jgi:myo-inositol-1(or 4)-monophosphatase
VDRTPSLAAFAEQAARSAAGVLREHAARGGLHVETKSSDTDPVSEADRDSEALLVRLIAEARPDDGLLGEEGAGRAGTTGIRWVIDPLDGTVNYLYRYPAWTVSVACEDADGPLAACVYHPALDEAFVAARGHGATLGGRPIHVNGVDDLQRALVATGFAYGVDERRRQAPVVGRVLEAARDVRRGGSAALDLCYVACGRVDAYYETGVNRWDWLGGSLVAREAGARFAVRERDGGPPLVLAAPPAIFAALEGVVAS